MTEGIQMPDITYRSVEALGPKWATWNAVARGDL